MAGLALETMANLVQAEFGGRIESEGAFITRVCDTDFGDFVIELDARVLKDRRHQDHLHRLGIELGDTDSAALDQWLADAAGHIVPHEIVAPPMPPEALPRLERMRAALQRHGARGTQSSLLYAFGLQLNIEAHSLEADWIAAVLRAFVLLYEALVKAEALDLARQLSPFVKPFPGPYVRQILQPGYQPDMPQLIDEYLVHNPTRNRPLDLLPLFATIDRDRVMAAPVEHALIKARPALHYRQPNCEIDDPHWTLARPFNGWVQVEMLAADPARLEATAADYLQRPIQALGQFADEWAQRIRAWL